MSLGSEFKEFAMKGNVIDLAVGVVIGAAFGKIVASLVADIIMPPIGLAVGGINFSDLAVKLGLDPTGKPVLLKYGRLRPDHPRVPDRRLRAVPADQGHQCAEAPAAAGPGRRAGADQGRTAADRDPRPAREALASAPQYASRVRCRSLTR